jgi:hypothetical protein
MTGRVLCVITVIGNSFTLGLTYTSAEEAVYLTIGPKKFQEDMILHS